MTGPTLALVLVAAAAHAAWNTASKAKRGDTLAFVRSYTALSAVLCVPVAAGVLLTGHASLGWPLVVGAVVSGALHVTYSLTLQTGYDRSDLGVVYPVARGTGPVLTIVVAITVLGEHLDRWEALGTATIVAGIVVVAGNPFGGARGRPLAGVAWGTATGATIAAYTLWDAWSVTTLHVDPLVYFTGTLLVETALLTRGAIRDRGSRAASLRANAVVVPTIAVLSPLAYVLVLMALRTAPVAVVAPLRESSIVVASLLAWRFFGEGHLARRLVGAAVVLAGIVAVGL